MKKRELLARLRAKNNKRPNGAFIMILFFALFLNAQNIYSQDKTITGNITDASGQPLPGASILEKDTTNGTQSDFDGNFSLNVTNVNATLVVSFIGFLSQEIAVAGQEELKITLLDDAANLDEVVIIGYGSQKKSDLTGSVATISSEELRSAVFNDVSQMLQGRTSGVQISNTTAAPGSAPQIRIRGNNSINGSNDPLWVVDGVPLTNAPIFSPNEIESFEILKDASATAIYGARGANGVVLLNTKSGKKGKTTFEVYANNALSNPIDTYNVISNNADFVTLVNEARPLQSGGIGGGLPPLVLSDYPATATDWQDVILQSGVRTEFGLNISGGNEKSSLSASANFLDDKGIILGSSFKRGSLRLNMDFNPTDWISLDFRNSVSYSETKNPNPLQGDRNGSTFSGAASAPPVFTNDYVGVGLDGFPYTSPLTLLNNREFETQTTNLLSSLNTTFKLAKHLTFANNTSVNLRSINPRNYEKSVLGSQQSTAFLAEIKGNDFVVSNFFIYDNDFESKHDITLTLGQESSWFNQINFTSSASDFPTDELGPDNIGVANEQRTTSSRIQSTLNSFFARANYVFDNKYLLNATFRADGSSRFAKNNKWGYFPSFGAAYVVSNEDFFKVDAINNLKLRASWGQVGSQAVPAYSSLFTFGTEFTTFDTTAPNSLIQSGVGNQVNFGISPTRVNNDNLKWETTTSFNIGVDLGLFNNKLDVTVDYYKKTTTDLLQAVLLPPQTGFSSALINLGEIENKGIEIALGMDLIQKKDFSWSNSFNIAFNKSKVVDLGGRDFVAGARVFDNNPSQPYVNIFIPGQEFGVFYGLETNGLYQASDANPDGTTDLPTLQSRFQPGWNRYEDLNNDGTISRESSLGTDKTVIGNPNPDFIFGWNHDFNYKNFSLNLFFQGTYGNDIMNLNHFTRGSGFLAHNGANQSLDYFNNRWTLDNQHNDPRYPRVGSSDNVQISNANVEDGSYIRLKNISLRYNLPVQNTNFLSSAEIYFTGTNIFTITNYSGLDPDVNTGVGLAGQLAPGVDAGGFPATKQYLLGLKLNF